MFSRREKPLPVAVLKPDERVQAEEDSVNNGILLGQGVYWTPERLPNGHIVAIGASGSGKTQTLKAIAYELHRPIRRCSWSSSTSTATRTFRGKSAIHCT
jgi:ATP-dependent protease Clp ATPase subunit